MEYNNINLKEITTMFLPKMYQKMKTIEKIGDIDFLILLIAKGNFMIKPEYKDKFYEIVQFIDHSLFGFSNLLDQNAYEIIVKFYKIVLTEDLVKKFISGDDNTKDLIKKQINEYISKMDELFNTNLKELESHDLPESEEEKNFLLAIIEFNKTFELLSDAYKKVYKGLGEVKNKGKLLISLC